MCDVCNVCNDVCSVLHTYASCESGADVDRCLRDTGADAIMSAIGLLLGRSCLRILSQPLNTTGESARAQAIEQERG